MDLNKLPQVHVNYNASVEIKLVIKNCSVLFWQKRIYILAHPVISAEQYSCLFSFCFSSKVKFYNTIFLQCDPSA